MKVTVRIGAALVLATLAAGCSSISDRRGYMADEALIASVQPGIDNQESVEGTLGRPSFASQYGPTTWYYVSSTTSQRPFGTPKIKQHSVLAVEFDAAGNVTNSSRWGADKVVQLSADGSKTPTLGKNRGFLQDLFGNIGQVGSFGGGAQQPGQ